MLQSVNFCSLVLIVQVLKKILNINVHINGEPINRVSVAEKVGMYIDENLKWDVHIDKIIPKISHKNLHSQIFKKFSTN